MIKSFQTHRTLRRIGFTAIIVSIRGGGGDFTIARPQFSVAEIPFFFLLVAELTLPGNSLFPFGPP